MFQPKAVGEQRRAIVRWGVALIASAAAAVLMAVLPGMQRTPLMLPSIAVLTSVIVGGLGPGLLALALGTATAAVLDFPGLFAVSPGAEQWVPLAAFAVLGALWSVLIVRWERNRREVGELNRRFRRQLG